MTTIASKPISIEELEEALSHVIKCNNAKVTRIERTHPNCQEPAKYRVFFDITCTCYRTPKYACEKCLGLLLYIVAVRGKEFKCRRCGEPSFYRGFEPL